MACKTRMRLFVITGLFLAWCRGAQGSSKLFSWMTGEGKQQAGCADGIPLCSRMTCMRGKDIAPGVRSKHSTKLVKYAGRFDNADECEAACLAYQPTILGLFQKRRRCEGFVFHGPEQDGMLQGKVSLASECFFVLEQRSLQNATDGNVNVVSGISNEAWADAPVAGTVSARTCVSKKADGDKVKAAVDKADAAKKAAEAKRAAEEKSKKAAAEAAKKADEAKRAEAKARAQEAKRAEKEASDAKRAAEKKTKSSATTPPSPEQDTTKAPPPTTQTESSKAEMPLSFAQLLLVVPIVIVASICTHMFAFGSSSSCCGAESTLKDSAQEQAADMKPVDSDLNQNQPDPNNKSPWLPDIRKNSSRSVSPEFAPRDTRRSSASPAFDRRDMDKEIEMMKDKLEQAKQDLQCKQQEFDQNLLAFSRVSATSRNETEGQFVGQQHREQEIALEQAKQQQAERLWQLKIAEEKRRLDEQLQKGKADRDQKELVGLQEVERQRQMKISEEKKRLDEQLRLQIQKDKAERDQKELTRQQEAHRQTKISEEKKRLEKEKAEREQKEMEVEEARSVREQERRRQEMERQAFLEQELRIREEQVRRVREEFKLREEEEAKEREEQEIKVREEQEEIIEEDAGRADEQELSTNKQQEMEQLVEDVLLETEDCCVEKEQYCEPSHDGESVRVAWPEAAESELSVGQASVEGETHFRESQGARHAQVALLQADQGLLHQSGTATPVTLNIAAALNVTAASPYASAQSPASPYVTQTSSTKASTPGGTKASTARASASIPSSEYGVAARTTDSDWQAAPQSSASGRRASAQAALMQAAQAASESDEAQAQGPPTPPLSAPASLSGSPVKVASVKSSPAKGSSVRASSARASSVGPMQMQMPQGRSPFPQFPMGQSPYAMQHFNSFPGQGYNPFGGPVFY